MEAGADSFGDALHLDGVCGPVVPAPPGADRQARLLARLGRDASHRRPWTGGPAGPAPASRSPYARR